MLHELGISATLYGVLSRGLLSGSKPKSRQDFRAFLPRFAGEAGEKNAKLVDDLRQLAERGGRTPAQLCLGWVLAKEPKLVPLVGARTTEQLEDQLAILEKPLSAAEVNELEKLIPKGAIAGTRYMEAQMAHLDSER